MTTRRKGKSMGIMKKKIGLSTYDWYIPDYTTFKTLQLRIGGWVAWNNDYNQRDIDRLTGKIKKKIQQNIREQQSIFMEFKPTSIVDISMGKETKGNANVEYRFGRIDVVLFPNFPYNRNTVECIAKLEVMKIHNILNHDFKDEWIFVESKKRKIGTK